MVVITLSRRPLGAGSVAANVLQYGTGALNIDACRIRTEDSLNGGAYAEDATERHDGAENWRFKRGDIGGLEGKSFVQPTGRWPANLILQHLSGCAPLGIQKVASNGRVRHKKSPDGLFVGGQPGVDGHADADGLETISAWSCVDGCPCLDLDRQSGSTQSPKTYVRSADGHNDAIYAHGIGESAGATSLNYGDEGGASRYFKQVSGGRVSTDDILDIVGESVAGPPDDLISYLYTMITPTHVGGESLVALDLAAVDWAAIPDGRYHGVIARGEPTQEQVEHLWRIVKPGAHVMLIAPDSCPTGHRGACTLEDKGFEIRDAILWVREAGRLHYVPKANTKERNAGTVPLAVKRKGVPIFVLTAKAAADEEVMEEVCSVLTEAGVAEEVIDSITDNGILKDKIPDSILKHFKMQEGSGKYGNVHPCLHPDALVMTPVGHRRISTLSAGDLVYAADGKFHAAKDVSHHPYTSPDLYEISVLGTNLKTLASDNHPFLIWRPVRDKKGNIIDGEVQWVEAKDIKKGDYTLTPVPADRPYSGQGLPDLKGYETNEDFWFLFGLYVAEGVAQPSGNGGFYVYPSYSLNVDEVDLVGRIRSFFEPRVKVSVYSKPGTDKGIQVMAFDPVVGALFVELCGKGATKKVLHPEIWNIDRKYLRAMFDGHMAGDGGKVRTYWQSKTSSEALSGQLRLVGDALGYRTNHHRYDAKPGSIQGRAFKTTSDENHLRFYSDNQFLTERKASRPHHVTHDGVRYCLSYVKSVTEVPYEGDVWNLSVEGSPTFQTAVGMSHNTVKPKDVMKRLLSDVPKGVTVLDPFMGSGSMGIACLETGHGYIGIEKERDYAEIAVARLNHWNAASEGWNQVPIESEVPEFKGLAAEKGDGDALDLFGD